MSISEIIFLVFGVVLVLGGLASIFTGKVYLMGSSAAKYTEESLKKYSRPYGLENVLTGVGLICFHFLNEKEMFKIGDFSVSIGLFAIVVSIIISVVILVTTRKVLVKK